MSSTHLFPQGGGPIASITGGTINGATIGGTNPAPGTFTTLTATGLATDSAPADTNVSLLVSVNRAGTVTNAQRVTIGAVDSGGAGFRVLRVPN